VMAGLELGLAVLAKGEELPHARAKGADQVCDKRECIRGQDRFVSGTDRCVDDDTFGEEESHEFYSIPG